MNIKEILSPEIINLVNDGDVKMYIISTDISLKSNVGGYICHAKESKQFLIDLGNDDDNFDYIDPVAIKDSQACTLNGGKDNSISVLDVAGNRLIISFYKIVPFDLGDRQKEPALV